MSKHKEKSRKKLSIIIPFYGQRASELAIPLASINCQTGIDFKQVDVHLVNDGGEPLELSHLAIFKNLDLHYHELPENVGPGLARQYGIDHSEGEFIMFIDSDDSLFGALDLLQFFNSFQNPGKLQVIASNFLIEGKKNGASIFRMISPNDTMFSMSVVAKCYKRQFLENVGLRFRPELRFFEDSYFAHLALVFTENIVALQAMTYLARYRLGSETRKNNHAAGHDLGKFVLSCRLKLEKVQEVTPTLLGEHLETMLSSIFLKQKRQAPTDENQFKQEFQRLLAEFPYDWQANLARLQGIVNAESQRAGSSYNATDTTGLREFFEKYSA